MDNQLLVPYTVYPLQDTSMDTNGTGRIYQNLLQIDSIEIEYTVNIDEKVDSTRGKKCTKMYPSRMRALC